MHFSTTGACCFENTGTYESDLSQHDIQILNNIQGRPRKQGNRLVTIILSVLNKFNIFFTGRFLDKFAVLTCNFAKYSPIKKNFTQTQQ